MNNLFYISSSGSMATQWMSLLLSASPLIKCFHGSVGLQKLHDSNLDIRSALLLLGQWVTENRERYVGLTHLSMNHGAVALKTCESLGVPFCALVRNPILATDSQYQERVKSEKIPDIKLARYILMIKSINGLERHIDTANRSEVLFFRCADSVISHVIDIEANDCQAFKFEEYTKSYSTVQKIIQTITKGSIADDHNVNIAFSSLGKKNSHRVKKAGPDETLTKFWSTKQRNVFVALWQHYLSIYQRKIILYPEIDELLSKL